MRELLSEEVGARVALYRNVYSNDLENAHLSASHPAMGCNWSLSTWPSACRCRSSLHFFAMPHPTTLVPSHSTRTCLCTTSCSLLVPSHISLRFGRQMPVQATSIFKVFPIIAVRSMTSSGLRQSVAIQAWQSSRAPLPVHLRLLQELPRNGA